MSGIAVLCTANQCRSPVAEGFLRQRLVQRGIEIEVSSAGFLEGGAPCPAEIVRAASMFGLDLSGHVSRQIDWTALADADLIITMDRQHVRDVAVTEPSLWRRTFTLRELLRRGGEVEARPADVSIGIWLEWVHEGRRPSELLGADPVDEVSDPMGGLQADYDEMAETLYGLTHELVGLLWPTNVD